MVRSKNIRSLKYIFLLKYRWTQSNVRRMRDEELKGNLLPKNTGKM